MLEPSDNVVQELIRGFVAAGSVPASDEEVRRFFHKEWAAANDGQAHPGSPSATWLFFNEQVIDGHDNWTVPNGLYASVMRMRPSGALGPGQRLYSEIPNDEAQRLNEETSHEVAGEWSIQWHGYVDDEGNHAGPSPFDYANRFWLWCKSSNGVSFLSWLGLTFVRCTEPRDLSAIVSDETWERRSGVEFTVQYRQRSTVPVPSIDRVSVEVGAT